MPPGISVPGLPSAAPTFCHAVSSANAAPGNSSTRATAANASCSFFIGASFGFASAATIHFRLGRSLDTVIQPNSAIFNADADDGHPGNGGACVEDAHGYGDEN